MRGPVALEEGSRKPTSMRSAPGIRNGPMVCALNSLAPHAIRSNSDCGRGTTGSGLTMTFSEPKIRTKPDAENFAPCDTVVRIVCVGRGW